MLSSDFNIIVDSGGGINSWKLIVKFLEIEIGGINGCINHACNNYIYGEKFVRRSSLLVKIHSIKTLRCFQLIHFVITTTYSLCV